MKVNTQGQLFDHRCQIKDMKLSGFGPKGLRYHCMECGGVLVLKLDKSQWDEAFGEKPTFKLSKKILQQLEAAGAEPILDESEVEDVSAELEAIHITDTHKFVWTPSDDDDDDEDED